jgi:hypothetical protein
MRQFRAPFTVLALLMLLFDATMYWQALVHGFPPASLLSSDEGLLLEPTTRQKVEWYAFLLGAGLVQAFVFILTWKAWRNPQR